jgi:hypothetical protein
MTRDDLKNFIHTNCMSKKGRAGFNSRAGISSWWSKKDYTEQLTDIIKETDFYDGDNISRRCWYIINDIYDAPKCVVCDAPTNFKAFSVGFFRTCCNECATKDEVRNQKIRSKLDYITIQEKVKRTNLERYGVEYWFQTEESVTKIKNTKLEKYGDEKYNNPERMKRTNMERYGVEHWFNSVEGQERINQAKERNGGSLSLTKEINARLCDIDLLLSLNETLSVTEIAEEIGVTPRAIQLKFESIGHTPKRHPHRQCLLQGKLYDDIRTLYTGEVIFNDNKTIAPKELDIVIPDKNLAIELNGLYWHSEKSISDKRKMVHKNKLDLCNSKGVQLIQFTDKEYLEKKELVLGIIATRLDLNINIGARKCEVHIISNKEAKDFLNNHHFQGYVPAKFTYGLYYQGELISVMSFGKTRFNRDDQHEYELLRFCVKNGYSIVGGAQKLFSRFIKDVHPKSIISYCDLSKFSGDIYTKLGFTHSHTSSPNYFYHKKSVVYSRYQAQKHKLKDILEDFDPALSESENMFNNGFYRYWDCGMSVYEWSSG